MRRNNKHAYNLELESALDKNLDNFNQDMKQAFNVFLNAVTQI
jgi:hypothetical protein